MSDLYLRKIGLAVYKSSSKPGQQGPEAQQGGLDLSQMKIQFRTFAADVDAPPTGIIKIYNLSDTTARSVRTEFQKVTLQAGYENGPYGVIFQGWIKMVKAGREDAINSFVEIYASDLDLVFRFANLEQTLRASQTSAQAQAQAIQNSVQANGGTINAQDMNALQSTGGTLPRGKVLYGMTQDRMTDLANSTGTTWSVQNGEIRFRKFSDVDPGQAVVLTSQTGLIGVPTQEPDGIHFTCLINPNIKTGARVRINNKSILATNIVNQGAGFPKYTDWQSNILATTNADGIYKVLVVEHEGDIRGNPWYSHCIALSLDGSAGSTTDAGTQGF
jgi:hypothetical protein